MNFEFLQQATSREREQFKSVCNQLLSRTYVVRTLYRPGKGRVNNPDYTFLSRNFEAVQEYLGLLDWDLRHDDLNGYYYVANTDEANRCNLNKKETAILLALRLLYEDNQDRLGLEQDAVCTVRDAGPGMDEATRRRIFEKFYQGDTAHAAEGNGLGLSLVKRIVDLCHGSVEVESAPGKGSAFTVRLPLEEAANQSADPAAAQLAKDLMP